MCTEFFKVQTNNKTFTLCLQFGWFELGWIFYANVHARLGVVELMDMVSLFPECLAIALEPFSYSVSSLTITFIRIKYFNTSCLKCTK